MRLSQHVRHNRLALAGSAILAVFSLAAIFATVITPQDPQVHFNPFLSPSLAHLLGTDDVGRDIFAQLVVGTRVSLLVGILTGLLAVSVGVLVGLTAGFRRGALDELLMGLTDIVLVIPALPLVMTTPVRGAEVPTKPFRASYCTV